MTDRKLGYALICFFLAILCVLCAYCLRPLLSPPHTRIVAFEKIGNLRIDDQVRLKGTSYGSVKKIDWTKRKVFVTIQGRKPMMLHAGYVVMTMDAGIMGDRMIMIDDGPQNAATVPPADTIVGTFLPGVSEAVGYTRKLNEFVDSLRDMTNCLLYGDIRHTSLVTQTKGVLKTVDSLSKTILSFTSAFESTISSSLDSMDNFVNQASQLTQSFAVSAPEFLDMFESQVAKAGGLVLTIDTTVNRLRAASADLSKKDNILWQNDIKKLSGDLVRVQKTLADIQKEMLKFKTYLRFW